MWLHSFRTWRNNFYVEIEPPLFKERRSRMFLKIWIITDIWQNVLVEHSLYGGYDVQHWHHFYLYRFLNTLPIPWLFDFIIRPEIIKREVWRHVFLSKPQYTRPWRYPVCIGSIRETPAKKSLCLRSYRFLFLSKIHRLWSWHWYEASCILKEYKVILSRNKLTSSFYNGIFLFASSTKIAAANRANCHNSR